MKHKIKNTVCIFIGTLLYAIGISLFLDPNNLAPGGVIGVSVILNRLFGLSTGTLYLIINIPIIALGIWKFGWKFMTSTAMVVVLNSFLTDFISEFDTVTNEPLLAALAGGGLIGLGIGMVFRSGTTTGGLDIIIKVIKSKYKHIQTGMLFLMIDITVVTVSGIIFRDFNVAMYAAIAVVVSGRVMDRVLYGSDEARMIYIISDKNEEIAKEAMEKLEVGVTYLEGKGAYSNSDKKVIMCVIRKQLAPKLEDIVKGVDPACFMIISSASEIYGEGYKNILQAKL